MPEKPVTLLTGFSAFPGAPLNPTKEILRRLRHTGIEIPSAIIFPVSYRIVDRYLDSILDHVNPDIVISFGLSYEANGFTLETTAWNQTDRNCGDIFGSTNSSAIPQSAPDRHNSKIPLERLCRELSDAGITSSMSDDPGRYLCNHLYFRILDRYKTLPAKWACFVHIPPMVEQIPELTHIYPEKQFNHSISTETLATGIKRIVNFTEHEWGKIYG